MHWISRRNTISSMPRLSNSDLDGFRRRPMSASIHEHLFVSSHADLGSPAIVVLTKHQTLKLDFMHEAMSRIAKENRSGPRRSSCCTPEAENIKFSLGIRGDGDAYDNDTSLKISGQLIMHLRRRATRRMELKVFLMSSFARM